MLSRVADSLYWMSRYLERTEHTARLLDVNLHQMLDQTPGSDNLRWERMLASLRMTAADLHSDDENKRYDGYTITHTLTFDPAVHGSIVSCIAAARENARQVREQISSEMWEQLNRLFLKIKSARMDESWQAEPHEVFQSIKQGVHLFQGITDATMNHGEGWQFIQIGRFLERAGATAVLLDAHFTAMVAAQSRSNRPDYLALVGLLKSCTAFEAYCKVYTADLRSDSIAEFLLLNAEFPHSVRFAAGVIQDALHAIATSTGARTTGRVERLVGRLRASLDYAQVDEILDGSMHTYLENIQRQCAQIHTAIHQIYIAYPIDAALSL